MKNTLPKNQKYQNSHITQKELHRIWWQLHDALENHPQLWLKPINLKEFCTLLSTNQKYFSQTINQATGVSINTFIFSIAKEKSIYSLRIKRCITK